MSKHTYSLLLSTVLSAYRVCKHALKKEATIIIRFKTSTSTMGKQSGTCRYDEKLSSCHKTNCMRSFGEQRDMTLIHGAILPFPSLHMHETLIREEFVTINIPVNSGQRVHVHVIVV